MKHVINLLQPEECRFLSAAQTSPVLKLGAIGGGLLLAALIGLYIMNAQQDLTAKRKIVSRWKEIESQVDAAKIRAERSDRIVQSLETLQGWKTERLPLHELLTELAQDLPQPLEKIQFMRLHLETNFPQLQTNPSQQPYTHPVTSQSSLFLRGILESDRPEALLATYQANLGQDSIGEWIEEIQLQDIRRLRDQEGQLTGRTLFNYQLQFKPRELKP